MSIALILTESDSQLVTKLFSSIGIEAIVLKSHDMKSLDYITIQQPDFVVINTNIADGGAIVIAEHAAKTTLATTIILVDEKIAPEIDAVLVENGIISFTKPIDIGRFLRVLKYVDSIRSRFKHLLNENAVLKEEVEETKLVSRAKLLLMQNLGMDEKAAHDHILKQAMNSRTAKKAVAKEIIINYGK